MAARAHKSLGIRPPFSDGPEQQIVERAALAPEAAEPRGFLCRDDRIWAMQELICARYSRRIHILREDQFVGHDTLSAQSLAGYGTMIKG